MPGGDRTGPRGSGPMTGRGLGWCSGARPGGFFGGYGRSGAFGSGRGRGWRHMYYATGMPGWAREGGVGYRTGPGYPPSSAQDELGYLKEYTAGLEEELNALRARMAGLEGARKAEQE